MPPPIWQALLGFCPLTLRGQGGLDAGSLLLQRRDGRGRRMAQDTLGTIHLEPPQVCVGGEGGWGGMMAGRGGGDENQLARKVSDFP